jgi:hypothetical protein
MNPEGDSTCMRWYSVPFPFQSIASVLRPDPHLSEKIYHYFINLVSIINHIINMGSDIVAEIAKILNENAKLEEPTVKAVWMRTLEIEVSNTILTSEEQLE